MTVILVSNRVADPSRDGPIEGGLASALLQAVKTSGATWVGTRVQQTNPDRKEPLTALATIGAGTTARVDLPSNLYQQFYRGFANSGLWPVLHSRPDLIRAQADDYAAYREVNRMLAGALRTLVRPDAAIWVHDYHFMTLAEELHRLNVHCPVGFFLHTPFPSRIAFASLPHHRDLVRALLHYDLIGFQTEYDRANFVEYVEQELGMAVEGGAFVTGTKARLASFPIGINVEAFAEGALRAAARPDIARLRASLQAGQLAIGVDRIDYSKGLENRMRAFDRLFQVDPYLKRQVSFLQIALPSRGDIPTYEKLRGRVATLVSEINGRHGEVDWTPIRYLNKGFAQSTLAGLYRTAQIGVVTPLVDGMNLVAKEYVAAQNPLNPGVLVLSRFAGAARQLDAALLVNPNDVDDVADAIRSAMAMSVDERRDRWEAMMAVLRGSDIDSWFNSFLSALTGTPRRATQIPLKKVLPPYAPALPSAAGMMPKPAIPSTNAGIAGAITSKPASAALTSNAFGIAAAKSS